MYLVFDVGGTFIKYAWMTKSGEIEESGKIPTMRGKNYNITDFIESLGKIYDEYKVKGEVEGIAMGVPGLVDIETCTVYNGGAIHYLDGMNMQELLGKRCDGVRVSVENDAKCAALAEAWLGNAKDVSTACVLIFGTGIGGGIVIDGKVHHGNSNVAGELSWHICNMKREDVDNLVSETELDEVEDVFEKLAFFDTIYCGTAALVHNVAKKKGLKDSEVSGELIYQWAKNGDEIAIEALEDTYFNIAKLCFNVYVTVGTDVILIGGGISEEPEFIKGIQRYIDKMKFVTGIYAGIKIDTCKYHNRSNLLGALYNFEQKYGL